MYSEDTSTEYIGTPLKRTVLSTTNDRLSFQLKKIDEKLSEKRSKIRDYIQSS